MTTARELVARAHRLLGQVVSGDVLGEAYAKDGLVALNSLLESWTLDKLTTYAWQDETFTLYVGQASYAVGPAEDMATEVPIKVEKAYVRVDGQDTLLRKTTAGEWASITNKTLPGPYPSHFNYEVGAPTGLFQLYPVPNQELELHLVTWKQLDRFPSLETVVELPKGYERALAYNLAIELAPEFSVKVTPITQSVALQSLEFIRRQNSRPVRCRPEFPGAESREYSVETDV